MKCPGGRCGTVWIGSLLRGDRDSKRSRVVHIQLVLFSAPGCWHLLWSQALSQARDF